MKARNFLIYTGYAERGSWSCLAFRHHYGFDSVEEALHNFGECILSGLEEYLRKCIYIYDSK